MGYIKELFASKAIPMATEMKEFIKKNENTELGTYTIGQAYGGMKSLMALVTETSLLDPMEGIRFRGYTIPELREKLPHLDSCNEPLPEGLFYLLLVDEIPNYKDVQHIANVWARRAIVPLHVFKTIDRLPRETHPMTQFAVGILSLRD
jgi:citrate synthase